MAKQASTSYATMLAPKIKSFHWVIETTLWFKREIPGLIILMLCDYSTKVNCSKIILA